MTRFLTIRRLNTVLLILVVAVGLMIIFLPFLPSITYKIQIQGNKKADLEKVASSESVPSENRIIIPNALIDQPILEGVSISTVDKGPWRRPLTSTPSKGGNTVIVGHRFTYSPQVIDSFYNLDKVEIGDEITLFWDQQKYTYLASEILVVSANATQIESNSIESRLTLYTCTPLWSSANRLVVIAKPKVIES